MDVTLRVSHCRVVLFMPLSLLGSAIGVMFYVTSICVSSVMFLWCFCGVHWLIFTKPLSVVHLGTKMKWLGVGWKG